MSDLETRVALLEQDVKRHMENEEKFWKEMRAEMKKLTSMKDKWLGFGFALTVLGLIAVNASHALADWWNG